MDAKVLVGVGAGLAALAALPGLSQTSGDAALEAACRAAEVTSPASCPCTITKARAAGVTDAQLASLFKDDGHSKPVPQAVYSRFWQVKSQCIADAMMANLGVSPGNPLPGVPEYMRPKPPGSDQGAPVSAAPPPYARPLPSNRQVGVVPVRAPSAGPACDGGPFSDPQDIAVCGDTGKLETKLLYDRALEDYPALLNELKRRAQKTFTEVSGRLTRRDPYGYIVSWDLVSANGPLISVAGADGDTSRGRLDGSTALVWDKDRNTLIEWRDVFGAQAWDGPVRARYCTALRARAAESREPGGPLFASCPALDPLTITLIDKDAGTKALSVSAPVGVLASYATSALYDGIEVPVDSALVAAAAPRFRDALGGTAAPPARGSLTGVPELADGFALQIAPTATLQALRDATPAEFQPLANDNAGCMAMIDRQPAQVREANRANCRRVMAMSAADFIALDIAAPSPYSQSNGTAILPRKGGKACIEAGCYWYFLHKDGYRSSHFGRETGSLTEPMDDYDP